MIPDELVEHFERIRETLSNNHCDADRRIAFDEFWHLLQSVEKEPAPTSRDSSRDALAVWLAEQWAIHISGLERRQSQALLAAAGSPATPNSILAMEDYAGIRCETALLGDRPVSRLVCVGCGPFPETLIGLCDDGFGRDSARGIDRDQVAAKWAARIAQAFAPRWPGRAVSVTCGNGHELDYADVDLVFIANGVAEKGAVLDRIRDTAPARVRVLARTPIRMGKLLYEPVDLSLHQSWRMTATADPTRLSQTLLLERCELRARSAAG